MYRQVRYMMSNKWLILDIIARIAFFILMIYIAIEVGDLIGDALRGLASITGIAACSA